MPTNLRLTNVRKISTSDGLRWVGDVWYGDQQIVGVVVMARKGCGPESVVLEPDHPCWRPYIAQLKGVSEYEIDWSAHFDSRYNSHA